VRWPARLACLLVLTGAEALGAEVSPFLQEQWLGATVANAAFPASLRKDLTSGLTNRVLVRIAMSGDGAALKQQSVEVTIRYDLWEETFATTIIVGGATAQASTHPTLDAVIAFLARLRLPRLFRSTELNQNARYVIRAELLLNPIDRERMDQISKWVRENSDDTPLGPDGVGARVTTSMSSEIFNRIFEQYAKGSDTAAAWHESAASSAFTLADLSDGKR
jgi:hypothetical protein